LSTDFGDRQTDRQTNEQTDSSDAVNNLAEAPL